MRLPIPDSQHSGSKGSLVPAAGAIKGRLPHGSHNLRDILAIHILKQTGSYEQASYAIQNNKRSCVDVLLFRLARHQC